MPEIVSVTLHDPTLIYKIYFQYLIKDFTIFCCALSNGYQCITTVLNVNGNSCVVEMKAFFFCFFFSQCHSIFIHTSIVNSLTFNVLNFFLKLCHSITICGLLRRDGPRRPFHEGVINLSSA